MTSEDEISIYASDNDFNTDDEDDDISIKTKTNVPTETAINPQPSLPTQTPPTKIPLLSIKFETPPKPPTIVNNFHSQQRHFYAIPKSYRPGFHPYPILPIPPQLPPPYTSPPPTCAFHSATLSADAEPTSTTKT